MRTLAILALAVLAGCSSAPMCRHPITITKVECPPDGSACKLSFSDGSDPFFVPAEAAKDLLGTDICMDGHE